MRWKGISSIGNATEEMEVKCNWGNGGVKQLIQLYGNAIGEMEIERN